MLLCVTAWITWDGLFCIAGTGILCLSSWSSHVWEWVKADILEQIDAFISHYIHQYYSGILKKPICKTKVMLCHSWYLQSVKFEWYLRLIFADSVLIWMGVHHFQVRSGQCEKRTLFEINLAVMMWVQSEGHSPHCEESVRNARAVPTVYAMILFIWCHTGFPTKPQ